MQIRFRQSVLNGMRSGYPKGDNGSVVVVKRRVSICPVSMHTSLNIDSSEVGMKRLRPRVLEFSMSVCAFLHTRNELAIT
jgi:hypothetical protein